MVQLNGHASVSIWQIIFFTPALFAVIYCMNKHGLGQNSGWLFLLTLSCFRIAGGATQLATYSSPSVGLFTASAILSSFGLSTLLLSSLGFLSRAADSSSLSRSGVLNKLVIHLVQLMTAVGLILVIVGDSNVNFSGNSMMIASFPIEIKVGIFIILAAWVVLCLLTATIVAGISHVIEHERLLAWAVLVALPFILIRLIFAILDIFLNDDNFNLLAPSVAVEWTLSVIEECFVVFLFLLVGFKVPQITQAEQNAVSGRGGNAGAGVGANMAPAGQPQLQQQQQPGRQKVRWRGTPLMTLIGIFTDMYSNRKKAHTQEMEQQPYPKPGQETSMA